MNSFDSILVPYVGAFARSSIVGVGDVADIDYLALTALYHEKSTVVRVCECVLVVSTVLVTAVSIWMH